MKPLVSFFELLRWLLGYFVITGSFESSRYV